MERENILYHSFCHIPGIGTRTEEKLWQKGIKDWSELLLYSGEENNILKVSQRHIEEYLQKSEEALATNNALYFQEMLPPSEQYRIFPLVRDSVCYLDIETTGCTSSDVITCVCLWNGANLKSYIRYQNLPSLADELLEYKAIVTYNGRAFDIPFMQRELQCKAPIIHIDLRFIMFSLGYRGGLKGVEKALGIDRKNLTGVDGYFAVLLWKLYEETNQESALHTLLAYNAEDTINLEKILVLGYNMKIDKLALAEPYKMHLSVPLTPQPYYNADESIIQSIKESIEQRNQDTGLF